MLLNLQGTQDRSLHCPQFLHLQVEAVEQNICNIVSSSRTLFFKSYCISTCHTKGRLRTLGPVRSSFPSCGYYQQFHQNKGHKILLRIFSRSRLQPHSSAVFLVLCRENFFVLDPNWCQTQYYYICVASEVNVSQGFSNQFREGNILECSYVC